MRDPCLTRLAAGVLAFSLATTFGGCAEKKPMLPGGGQHKITQIYIRAYSKEASAKDKGPVSLVVDERVQLRVLAAWAIPSVTEETEKAEWTVSDPTTGAIHSEDLAAKAHGRKVEAEERRRGA
jgi:hypothetical protein